VNHQLSFKFVRAIDDERNGQIDGMEPYAWLGRCYYPTAEEALQDARQASRLVGRVYVVEHKVTTGFEQYWPHSTYWQATPNPPFYGKVVGAFYYPKPNHYIVDLEAILSEVFEHGESPEEIAQKSKEALEKFYALDSERKEVKL